MSYEVLIVAAVICLPFVAVALVGVMRLWRGPGGPYSSLSITTMAAVLALLVWLWAVAPRPLLWRVDWIPAAGIGAGIFVDDLSLLFALLVAGIGLLTLLFSVRAMPSEFDQPGTTASEAGYYAYLLLFSGAMLGMIFSIDLIQFYVFWDLTDIASFLLIGLNWRNLQARRAAVKVLLVTTIGGLAVLAGLVALATATGTFALSTIVAGEAPLATSPLTTAALLLLLIGALAKSAQFPFHIWLPDAMIAPTPANAFLDSAALVAAGVFLLARLQPVFAGDPLWLWGVTGAGTISMLVGGVLALRATDFKLILAYSTISQYGFMFALLGLGTPVSLFGALLFFALHAPIKAGLFFVVASVTYATGTTILRRSQGLWQRLPTLFGSTTILVLSLAGVPPLAGFWMKETFLIASLEEQAVLLALFAAAVSALTLTYALRLLAGMFVTGDVPSTVVRRLPAAMLLVPGMLALLVILLGIWPALASERLIRPAVQAVTGTAPEVELAYHLSPELLLSTLALGLGLLAFVTRPRWSMFAERVGEPFHALDDLAIALAAGINGLGQRLLALQNGSLPRYLSLVVLALLVLMLYATLPNLPNLLLSDAPSGGLPVGRGLLDWALALLLLLAGIGTVLTLVLSRHLHVVLALGAVGYLLAAIFALLLAPSVGLVQVHVETLVTILFITALLRIPHSVRARLVLPLRQRLHVSLVLLAALTGFMSAWLSWLAIEYLPDDPIAPWFQDHAASLTDASDLVASILMHFRALDTLGEIIVFSIATAGVLMLVRLMREEAS